MCHVIGAHSTSGSVGFCGLMLLILANIVIFEIGENLFLPSLEIDQRDPQLGRFTGSRLAGTVLRTGIQGLPS